MFTPEDLDRLRAYGDLLFPEDGAAPRFSSADADGEVLALAIEQVDHRLAAILAALEATPGDNPGERLRAFESADPVGFTYFRDVLACCYLSTQRVWEIIGYNGRKPRPPRPGEAEMYLVGGILDPVVTRGPIYRLP